MLEINNLRVSFNTNKGMKEIVRGISLTVQKGEMLALVGESGSGKSLSALSVLKLLPASAVLEGSIRFNDKELLTANDTEMRNLRGNDISMIFQEPMTALNPLHTLGKQIAEIIEVHQGVPKLSAHAIQERVEQLLDQVGLSHFKARLNAYPHELSGGERQRVLIAMSIANNPHLLIADEPTTAVDVTIQAKILVLLKKLQKEREMGMLFITHDLTLVKRLADRVAVMQQGVIVEQGSVKDVFAAPQHEYTKKLLSSEPKGTAVALSPEAPVIISGEKVRVEFSLYKGVFRRKIGAVIAVENANISIKKGETLGIVGESGSGKTTLALALLRLQKSTGRIVFLSQDIGTLSTKAARNLRHQMQLVFQDPYSSLNPRMSVQEIIEEGLRVHEPQLDTHARIARVDTILQEVGLSADMKDRYPHEFSGGQRQRISIARAMVLKPQFIILDEPTSALDLSVQSQIVELLKRFQIEQGVSYIFISHDLRVVRAIAHRIIVMKKGAVVEEATTFNLFTHPQQPYTQELLKAAYLEG